MDKPIQMKLKEKYLVGKVAGGSIKPGTNIPKSLSLGKSLHKQWIGTIAGQKIHDAFVQESRRKYPSKVMKKKFKYPDAG